MRSLKIAFIFLLPSLLVSCIPSSQLTERAIVEGIGIDKYDDGYTVSVQYYDPDSENTESSQTTFVKDSADSISLAIAGINSKISKELYFGHSSIIVIGKSAAEKDIIKILEYFDLEPQIKSDICVFVADTAESIVGFDDKNKKIAPVDILSIVENAAKLGSGCEFKMFKAIGGSISESRCFALPYGGISQTDNFEILGSCVFKNGVLANTLGVEKTRGLQWYNQTINGYLINADGNDFEVCGCETSVDTILIDEAPVFKINITVKLKAPEKSNSFDEKTAKAAISQIVTQETENTIALVFKKMKCDLFGFSKRLGRSYPRFLEKNAELWYENYNAKIQIKTNCIFS